MKRKTLEAKWFKTIKEVIEWLSSRKDIIENRGNNVDIDIDYDGKVYWVTLIG